MWQKLTILVLAALVWPVSGQTATVPINAEKQWFEMSTPWRSPGQNPCRASADCTPEWAVTTMHDIGALPTAVKEEFVAREAAGEDRQPYWIHSGERIRVNTYAKEGIPYAQQYMHADFTDGQPRYASGHQIYHDGAWYTVALVAECGNWVLMIHPERRSPATPVLAGIASSLLGPSLLYGGSYGGGSSGGGGGYIGGGGSNHCVICENEPPVEPPVVPLPAPLLLLLSALAALRILSRRTTLR